MTLEQFTAELVSWIWSAPVFFLLLFCGLFFSLGTKLVQRRILRHGYACIRGHYDRADDEGHLTHFQALCAALSATIGLGNIAGVAVAVSLGGPGAVFWMWVVGFFGMALKFAECSLAVMFRDVRDVPDPSAPALVEFDAESRTLEYPSEPPPDRGAKPRARGEVRGGPMWYIEKAIVAPLRARGNPLWLLFKLLAIAFATATMLNACGGGNMFQGWNVSQMLFKHFHVQTYVSATVVSALVALVIIGGIRRIGEVASRLVPFMCVIYVLGALYVISVHAGEVPQYLALIVRHAFTPAAEGGAFAGVSVWAAFTWGLRRACFSNEAGEGSAAMAHAVARTDEPIREGVVAGLEPFIDTLIICTMSALVILMTGTWNRPPIGSVESVDGATITVVCDPEVDARYAPLFDQRIREHHERKLSIYIAHGRGEELVELKAPVQSVETDADGWTGVRRVTLNAGGLNEADRPKLGRVSAGQPVHLDLDGADLTGFAFDTVVSGFGKYMVTLGVLLFAFSTMISWSYYGEKGAEYLLGPRAILPFKFVFVVFVFLGMVLPEFKTVYDFSDATAGMMVICNLPAILILSPTVVRATRDYFRRLDAGLMPRVK